MTYPLCKNKSNNKGHEILLDHQGVCNLTTLNLAAFVKDGKWDYPNLFSSMRLITRMGSRITLVDMWDSEWDYVQKRDRLLGVSLTGIVETYNSLSPENQLQFFMVLDNLKKVARSEADSYHEQLGIQRSLLVTTVKPEGCYDIKHIRATEQGLLRVDEIADVSNLGFSEVSSEINATNGDKITQVFNKGLSEVVKVELNNGRTFTCTEQHPLSVAGLWKNAINLQIGDVLDVRLGTYDKTTNEQLAAHEAKNNHLQKNDLTFPRVIDEDLAWWVAAFFGNGSVQADKGYFDFMSEYVDVLQKYADVTKRLFNIDVNFEKHKTKNMFFSRISSVDLSYFLRINGLLKTGDFNIPLVFRKSSRSVLLSFVCGYLDTDGCFKNNGCTITTKNIDFARLFQEVTEAVGLSFSCYEYTRETTKGSGTYCDLQLSRVYSLSGSIDYINTHSIKANIQSPIVKAETSHKNPYKVKSITSVDELINTYDIEVEDSHWYYQGAIKSHNTISQLPTVSSGVHAPYAPYYKRRIRVSSTDPIAKALKDLDLKPVPENGQGDNLYAPECNTWVFEFPVKTQAAIRAIDEPAITQLERYKMLMSFYAEHTVSVTITVADHEWDAVCEWVFNNWDYCIGIAFLPRFDPSDEETPYPNMPYETTSESEYYNLEIDEDELIKLISFYETEYEDYELDASCGTKTGSCPVR